MMYARWHVFATCLLLLIPGVGICDTYVTGATYSLPPNVGAITDVVVEVNLYRPRFNPARSGELLRNGNKNLVPNGDPISTANTDTTTGAYRLRVPLAAGATDIFIIQFNRRDQIVTQELSGLLLTDAVPAQYDVVVPKALPQALPQAGCNNCSRGGFFSRLRCRH